jgi:O-antigen ligase
LGYGAFVSVQPTPADLRVPWRRPLHWPFRLDARILLGALALNAIALVAVGTGRPRVMVALAVVPILIVAVALLSSAEATVLVIAALTLELTIAPLNNALPTGTSIQVFPSDLVLVLALIAWFIERTGRDSNRRVRAGRMRSPALGVPLLLFTIAIASAAYRGHVAYGESLIGRPARMFLYAAIACAVVRVDTRRLYKGAVIAFYSATVWQLFNAGYYLATGRSQSIAPDLSTGGTRVLSIAVSLYLSGAFFLALINLALERPYGPKPLHAAVLLLSGAEIAIAFSRGTFITLALLAVILFLFLRDVRVAALAPLPLAIPLLVAGVLVLARTNSTIIPTLEKRINPSISSDNSIRWRQKANGELLKQFHQSPIFGVGFGKDIHFALEGQEVDTTQQAHNDFLYLLAGSGLFGLGSFLLLVTAAIGDALRRLRTAAEPHERALLLFASVTAASFLLNGLVEPLITLPSVILTIWTLLLLPMAVTQPAVAAAPKRRPEQAAAQLS